MFQSCWGIRIVYCFHRCFKLHLVYISLNLNVSLVDAMIFTKWMWKTLGKDRYMNIHESLFESTSIVSMVDTLS